MVSTEESAQEQKEEQSNIMIIKRFIYKNIKILIFFLIISIFLIVQVISVLTYMVKNTQ